MNGSDGANESTVNQIRDRLAEVHDRIESAGGSSARITVVAVTKRFAPDVAASAVAAGLVDLGENYAQELEAKAAAVPGAQWHMIGAVQRNKVKKLAGLVHLWQTVDRRSLAAEIAARDPGAAVLLQVNTTGEEQKNGIAAADVPRLLDECRELGLAPKGLMTVGPTGDDDPRPCFAALRALAEHHDLPEVSMGMTHDLESAVAEGATIVRVGTALFGSRPE